MATTKWSKYIGSKLDDKGPQVSRVDRERLVRRLEVLPPFIQTLASIAITIIMTFALRRLDAVWMTVASLLVAIVLILGAGVWSWRSRRFLDGATDRQPLGPDSPWWAYSFSIAACALIFLASFITYLGLRPTPNYASPYDNMDPESFGCHNTAEVLTSEPHYEFVDEQGVAVGRVLLIRSRTCETVWARVEYLSGVGDRLRGKITRIMVSRPGDDKSDSFASRLTENSKVSYGDMLSNSDSCVQARVILLVERSQHQGPTVTTSCR